MKTKTAIDNVGVRHGLWGEEMAARYLRRKGYLIVDRNTRPVLSDQRLEIDIVAWDSEACALVFVEVKQHAEIGRYGGRLRSVDRDKKSNLRRACDAWRRINKWKGCFRFDVIEVYGTPEGGAPVVDHIERVNLFCKPDRFVSWC